MRTDANPVAARSTARFLRRQGCSASLLAHGLTVAELTVLPAQGQTLIALAQVAISIAQPVMRYARWARAARPEDSTAPNQIQDEQPTSECRIICVHQHCTLVLRRLSASSARTLDQLGKGCWRSWLLRAHIRLIHDACRRSRRALLSGLKARSTACVNVLLSLESSPVPVWASGLPKRHLDRHTFALAAAILSTTACQTILCGNRTGP
jgi:hypothetical protein